MYAPVIRSEPTGRHAPVTWGEFVEAGLLRSYRRTGIPMAELRAFIELLRERYQVPYPLADRRPFVSGRELVLQAQEEAALDPDFWLVAPVRDQLLLLPASDAFTEAHAQAPQHLRGPRGEDVQDARTTLPGAVGPPGRRALLSGDEHR